MQRSSIGGLAVTLLALGLRAQDQGEAARYLDPPGIAQRLREVTTRSAADVRPGETPPARIATIGSTAQGREILAITIGADWPVGPLPNDAPGVMRRNWGQKPAVLIVAGLEGDRPVTSTVATRLVEKILAMPEAERAGWLQGRQIQVIPCANPDGLAASLATGPRREQRGNGRAMDQDRDGRSGPDEAARDLDGDGMILAMRVEKPAGTLVVDPENPRKMRAAEAAKGERGRYVLWPESLDGDGDGRYGEEAYPGVEPGRNFPHAFVENDMTAGIYATSEPESRALADWILAHPNIESVLVLGGHDDVVNVPEAADEPAREGGRGGRRAVSKLRKKDRPIWEELKKRRAPLIKHAEGAGGSGAGSLEDWCYFQLGLPAFAVNLFEIAEDAAPEAKKEEEKKPEPGKDAATAAAGEEVKATEPPPADPVAEDRLAIIALDFVDWHAFDHPTLGKVEIGGWKPLARMNPRREAAVTVLVEEEFLALKELLGLSARIEVDEPTIERLGAGLYAVEVEIRNDGFLPTCTEQGLTNRYPQPVLVELLADEKAILQGERRARFGSLEGRVGRQRLRWLLRADAGKRLSLVVAPPCSHPIEKGITLP